jgi:hypothetical protein
MRGGQRTFLAAPMALKSPTATSTCPSQSPASSSRRQLGGGQLRRACHRDRGWLAARGLSAGHAARYHLDHLRQKIVRVKVGRGGSRDSELLDNPGAAYDALTAITFWRMTSKTTMLRSPPAHVKPLSFGRTCALAPRSGASRRAHALTRIIPLASSHRKGGSDRAHAEAAFIQQAQQLSKSHCSTLWQVH